MPQEITSSLTTEKNKQENSPIWLYRVTLPDATIVRVAEWDVDVTYDGLPYLAIPIKHEGMSQNIMGEIDAVKVTWSNINRQIGAILRGYDGLIGCKVEILLVFADLLDDVTANITETFWIDGSSVTDTVAVFVLTTRLDLYQAKIPGRKMHRDTCSWVFKKRGCWLISGESFVAPDGFTNGSTECDHTRDGKTGCAFHTNQARFGGFPGIPQRTIWIV